MLPEQPQFHLDLHPPAGSGGAEPNADPALARFHPVVQKWFTQRLGEPSAQEYVITGGVGFGFGVANNVSTTFIYAPVRK